jgi:hypothetical protein
MKIGSIVTRWIGRYLPNRYRDTSSMSPARSAGVPELPGGLALAATVEKVSTAVVTTGAELTPLRLEQDDRRETR